MASPDAITLVLRHCKPGLASVVIAAYNQERFLGETLESVIHQNYRPIECLIVDDGSTDRTPQIVAEFETLNNGSLQMRYIRKSKQGAQLARNSGILASRGEFVQYLDGDDLLEGDKIERQVRFLTSGAGRDADVVYGDACFLVPNESGFVLGDSIGLGPVSDPLVGMLGSRFNPNFSYLCRRPAVEACGLWNPETKVNQDYEYFLAMACRGFRFQFVPGLTGKYRRHDGTRISDQTMLLRARATLRILEAAEKLAKDAGLMNPSRREAFARAYRNVSCWASGLDREVWKCSLERSIRLWPNLLSDRTSARLLQRAIGVWRAEALLSLPRSFKRWLRDRRIGWLTKTHAD